MQLRKSHWKIWKF